MDGRQARAWLARNPGAAAGLWTGVAIVALLALAYVPVVGLFAVFAWALGPLVVGLGALAVALAAGPGHLARQRRRVAVLAALCLALLGAWWLATPAQAPQDAQAIGATSVFFLAAPVASMWSLAWVARGEGDVDRSDAWLVVSGITCAATAGFGGAVAPTGWLATAVSGLVLVAATLRVARPSARWTVAAAVVPWALGTAGWVPDPWGRRAIEAAVIGAYLLAVWGMGRWLQHRPATSPAASPL